MAKSKPEPKTFAYRVDFNCALCRTNILELYEKMRAWEDAGGTADSSQVKFDIVEDRNVFGALTHHHIGRPYTW